MSNDEQVTVTFNKIVDVVLEGPAFGKFHAAEVTVGGLKSNFLIGAQEPETDSLKEELEKGLRPEREVFISVAEVFQASIAGQTIFVALKNEQIGGDVTHLEKIPLPYAMIIPQLEK